jgi:hypothetical protein
VVDHHAHGVPRALPADLDAFRGSFSESGDPRQWPHTATSLTYRRAIRELAAHLGCEPWEHAVWERKLAADPDEWAASLLRATGTELLLVDEGFPPAGVGHDWRRMGELAGCESRPVLRLERAAEEAPEDPVEHVRARVRAARGDGHAALKTIAAYRGGLDLDALPPPEPGRVTGSLVRDVLSAALEENEATGDPLPVQVHAGFGDGDVFLPRADPGYLKPLLERFRETTFVLLHCYPFVREAGWLAHVYGHVFLDLSLTIPHVPRGAEMMRQALELAPVSKLLYGSDAVTPELYFLAARRWREALAEVLGEALPAAEAEEAGRAILRENALAVYRLG